MKKQHSVEQLRHLLHGVKWVDFILKGNILDIEGVWFYGRLGTYLGRHVAAVISEGKFVAIRTVSTPFYILPGTPILNPNSPERGLPISFRGGSANEHKVDYESWKGKCGWEITELVIPENDGRKRRRVKVKAKPKASAVEVQPPSPPVP